MFIWSKNTKKSFCARQLNPVSHGFHTDRCQNEEKYKIQKLPAKIVKVFKEFWVLTGFQAFMDLFF